jgi:hypothetical protein
MDSYVSTILVCIHGKGRHCLHIPYLFPSILCIRTIYFVPDPLQWGSKWCSPLGVLQPKPEHVTIHFCRSRFTRAGLSIWLPPMEQTYIVEVEDVSRLGWRREGVLLSKNLKSIQSFYLRLRQRIKICLPLSAPFVPGEGKPCILYRNAIFSMAVQ